MDDDKTAADLNSMLDDLSEEELEIAARSSFHYLRRSVQHSQSSSSDGNTANEMKEERMTHARSMARRYYKSKQADVKVALAKMKATIAFRKGFDIDGLRMSFPSPGSSDSTILSQPTDVGEEMLQSMIKKYVFVQGFDKAGRALWLGNPSLTQVYDRRDYIRDAVYAIERAIACSEVNGQDQFVAMVDYTHYVPFRNDAPVALTKELLSVLRNHYVGRCHSLYMVNAPWALRTIWNVFKPFAGRETRKKLHFVSNDVEEKQRVLGPVVDNAQAAPWMLPDGKMPMAATDMKSRTAVVKRFLQDISFDQPYTIAPKVMAPTPINESS